MIEFKSGLYMINGDTYVWVSIGALVVCKARRVIKANSLLIDYISIFADSNFNHLHSAVKDNYSTLVAIQVQHPQ